jgi:5-formyltetrahydrofolate cyclo-ligase
MKTEPSQQSLKSRMRKEFRQRRGAIGSERRGILDASLNEHLIDYVEKSTCSVIAAYLAFDGEPDLEPALKHLRAGGVSLALPVIHKDPARFTITFHRWPRNSELKPNRYGILEPAEAALIQLTDIDLVLVPMVAWDETGGRLGMGASFYDRLFQPFAALERPRRMGVAYQCQKARRIPVDPWDIPLHGVLSEQGWFTCTR